MLRSMLAAAVLLSATQAFAAKAKSYQVTGPVIAVEGDTVTVQKGKEKWEITKDAQTQGELPKVGDKVTIEYRMVATKIEDKGAAKMAKGKAEKGEKGAKAAKGKAPKTEKAAGGAAMP